SKNVIPRSMASRRASRPAPSSPPRHWEPPSPQPPKPSSLTTYPVAPRIRVFTVPLSTYSSPPVSLSTSWRGGTKGELAKGFHQLHHGPGVALAVVQQILAHPIALLPRDLVRHEQQPGDFHARH